MMTTTSVRRHFVVVGGSCLPQRVLHGYHDCTGSKVCELLHDWVTTVNNDSRLTFNGLESKLDRYKKNLVEFMRHVRLSVE